MNEGPVPAGRPRVIVVSGPTGSGKSALGLMLARALGGEIVNADSVQIYRDFNIGSAKPDQADLRAAVHHLVSVLDPCEEFNAGSFSERARGLVREIAAKGMVPVVAGGTGLYIRALLSGMSDAPAVPLALRAELDRRIEALKASGLTRAEISAQLHAELMRADPVGAARLQAGDLSRVKRSLQLPGALR